MASTSFTISGEPTPEKFDPKFDWFMAFVLVTAILLLVLITIVCILAYIIRRMYIKIKRLSPITDNDADMIFSFSNKHAEMMDNQISVSNSHASLTDPWNTRSGRSVDQCSCHQKCVTLKQKGLMRLSTHFHTYPKMQTGGRRKGWTQRVFSQPAALHYPQHPISSVPEEHIRTKIPRNRMVERLLMEMAQQREVNLNWPGLNS